MHADGHLADLGTTRRTADATLRRLLLARDRRCRFPGCGAVRFLHAHHVLSWEDGGPTDRADPHALRPDLRDGFGDDHSMTVGVLLDRMPRLPEPVSA